jgi:hypothetical protein
MRKTFIILAACVFIMAFILIPSQIITADSGNLIVNGDFETGDFPPDWIPANDSYVFYDNTYGGTFSYVAALRVGVDGNNVSSIRQPISNISSMYLDFGFSYWNVFNTGETTVEIDFIDSNTNPPVTGFLSTGSLPYYSTWKTKNYNIAQWWSQEHPSTNFPVFDSISVIARHFGNTGGSSWFDNFYLEYEQASGSDKTEDEILPEPAWIRDVEMTCYQVWINEENNFEFVFWWEYANNNWVKIYDMKGNEVFSIDMEKGNAHFEADLPDGFYTVKTFHNGFETPIQEFLIGKP